MSSTPFSISIPDADLEDLRTRLRATRWPDAVTDAGWDYGTDLDYLRELVAYWADGFDWRTAEADLNRHEQLLVEVDGLTVHTLRQPSDQAGAPTLLLLHGWPDSFYRFHKMLPLLGEFDVVVPSLPGFGFSERPSMRGVDTTRMAHILAGLMRELGVDSYFVHGGDVGGVVGGDLARTHPDVVRAVHLTDLDGQLPETAPADATDAEKTYLEYAAEWMMKEGAYWLIQNTKPQTAAVGLNDSPAGLAGWIVEKFRAWSDCGGDVESRFTRDELLVNASIYWFTQTIGSSFRVYYESAEGDRSGRVEVPMGYASFPKEILVPPREFGERFYDVRRWTEMPRGGHFAALEEPELLADDIATFFRDIDGGV